MKVRPAFQMEGPARNLKPAYDLVANPEPIS